jgi:Predicted hydrolases or acyltransferases (alpha/beta hydrolase superfamily)
MQISSHTVFKSWSQLKRAFGSIQPMKLGYTYYPCLIPGVKTNLIALHGFLFTNSSLERVLNVEPIRKLVNIYALDIRNHGDSEWTDSMHIDENLTDIHNFIKEKNLGKDNVLFGHSYGGGIAMKFLCDYSEYCKGGIILDVGVFDYSKDPEHQIGMKNKIFIDFLKDLNLDQPKEKIREIIATQIKSPEFLGHLMSQLVELPDGKKKWKMNIEVLYKRMLDQVTVLFQPEDIKAPYPGPVRILGTNSMYVRPSMMANYYKIFSQFDEKRDFVKLNTRHFANFDNPEIVSEEIRLFLERTLRL